MQNFSAKSSHNIEFLLVLSFLFPIFFWNCSLISLHHESSEYWPVVAAKERCRQLDRLGILAGSGQISFDSIMSTKILLFDFEYRTSDTLKIRIQDPFGRRLADLELSGETYHLRLIREGKYFTGTKIETAQTPLPIGTLTPVFIRRMLLAGPLECEKFGKTPDSSQTGDSTVSVRYKFMAGQKEPAELAWQFNDQIITVVYNRYTEFNELKIPAEIIISADSEQFSIIIHFSHFNSGMLKFQT